MNWRTYVKLDRTSKNKLIRNFRFFAPNSWETHCDHMTVVYGQRVCNVFPEIEIGQTVQLFVTHIGKSERTLAVRVEGFKTVNDIPHITLAVNRHIGAKPADSNLITEWKEVEFEYSLNGDVVEMLK